MKENQRRLIQAWVSKAENDLLNVQNNLRAERIPWDTVCFHCQQAAEKYLKAILVVHNLEIPRTHDLEALLNVIEGRFPALRHQRSDLQWLTTYAVAVRYPPELLEDTYGSEEGQRTYAIALAVRDTCREYLRSVGVDLSETQDMGKHDEG
jgi:HEPN domain-containing protein